VRGVRAATSIVVRSRDSNSGRCPTRSPCRRYAVSLSSTSQNLPNCEIPRLR